VLALDAATQLAGIKKVAVYEAPFIVDDGRPTTENDWQRIDNALAARRPGDAVNAFLHLVGVPGFVGKIMRLTPMWRKLERLAPTLSYDGAIVRPYQRGNPLPAGRWSSVRVPVLVTDGAKSAAWMRSGNRALANVLPKATYRTLAGQNHAVKPKAHAPVLVEFFTQRQG
jgi:hypothetical protein